MPLLYLEMIVGQFAKRGPVGVFERISPICKGKTTFV
jgi:hypothetical protein